MERAAAAYDPAVHSRNTEAYGQDPGVATQAFGSVALWILGRPREALAASNRSLETARRIDQPSSTAVALHFAAMLHQLRGDAEAAGRLARDSLELSAEEGFSFWHAGGQVLRGWSRVAAATTTPGAAASAAMSESDAGLADLRRGLDAWLATGSRTYHTYYLGLLADALQRLGRPREALRPLDEALSAAQLLPEGLYEAELYRLRGRSVIGLSGDPTHADAHDCFVKAVSIARGQGAKWFELRAATDLASLFRRRGQFATADELLASATGQFEFPPDSHEPAADLCKTAAN
jgi:tetratricopeptide (TPR) repeat protein